MVLGTYSSNPLKLIGFFRQEFIGQFIDMNNVILKIRRNELNV